MSKDKNKPLKERVNRKKNRDSRAKSEADRRTQSNNARAQNAGKPGYDQDGNILSEVEKLKIRQAQERAGDWQNNPNFDREKGGWNPADALKIITNILQVVPEVVVPLGRALTNPLQISQLHNDNKAGNVDEVWKIRNHTNYKSLPSNEQWLKNIDKARGMVQTADSRTLRNHLKPFTHGIKDYDKEGGSLRGVPDELRIKKLIEGKTLV